MKLLVLVSLVVASLAMAADDLAFLKTHEVPLTILTDGSDMTLYTYDRDTPGAGTSACNGGCAAVWPPLVAPAGEFKAPLSVVTRKDGSKQMAYQGRPLYLYAEDNKPGDTNGDSLQNIWHVVYLPKQAGQ